MSTGLHILLDRYIELSQTSPPGDSCVSSNLISHVVSVPFLFKDFMLPPPNMFLTFIKCLRWKKQGHSSPPSSGSHSRLWSRGPSTVGVAVIQNMIGCEWRGMRECDITQNSCRRSSLSGLNDTLWLQEKKSLLVPVDEVFKQIKHSQTLSSIRRGRIFNRQEIMSHPQFSFYWY